MQMIVVTFKYFKNKFFKNKKNKIIPTRKRDFLKIKTACEQLWSTKNSLDDYTWDDLDMNEVYSRIDQTITTPGEHALYRILKTPLFDRQILVKRSNIILYFQKNKEKREQIIKELSRIGRTDSDVTFILCHELKTNLKYRIAYNLFALLLLVNLISLFFTFNRFNFLSLVTLSFINMYLHYNLDFEFRHQVDIAQYLGQMINRTSRLINHMDNELDEYKDTLNSLYKKCKSIGKRSSKISRIEKLDVIADYINIVFLIRERNFFKISSDLQRYKKEVTQLYTIVGELDTFISIAFYRETLNQYTIPSFKDENMVLDIENAIHPLIEQPVPNSLVIKSKGIVISGSNMSGKSTFLRTVGINGMFAQTIVTCLASKWHTSFYNILSSINLNDDLLGGKSYYLSEAKAIQKIVKSCHQEVPCLALIDEIFKGTNPIERISAAAETLNFLSESNALTFVTTHDLQLIPMLKGYEQYYFKEDVSKNGLFFDFIIRKGISSSRNAVKILEYLGYPNKLINKINERIELAEKT